MLTEGEYILEVFEKAFAQNHSTRICLYGTGRFTKFLLEKLKDFNIVGVADFSYEMKVWENYRIIPKSDVGRETDFLVLITNPANIKKVYNKVQDIAERVKIYTIEKKDVRAEQQFQKKATLQEVLQNLKYYVTSAEDANAFERFRRRLLCEGGNKINDVYTLVNVFVAPWLLSYFAWFVRKVKELSPEIVLLSARDGYLFYQLCQMLPDSEALPKIIYFYTSRRCISVASIENESDIRLVAKRKYLGDKATFLQERFGIKICPKQEENLLSQEELALHYKRDILENAKEERKCLEAYLAKEGIDRNKDILLFDFRSGGTVQYYLEKVIGKQVSCLYYFRTRDEDCIERERVEGVITYSGEGCPYSWNLYTQWQDFFEAIVTAPHGMVKKFNKDGAPIFQESKSVKKQYFSQVERGCIDYMRSFGGSIEELSLKLSDCMAEILEYDCIRIDETVRKSFVGDDPYQGIACVEPF